MTTTLETRTTLPPARCLVGGRWHTAVGASYEIVDPVSEAVLGSTPEAGAEVVDEAVRSAAAAQRDWVEVPLEERAALLERVADLLEREAEPMARLVSREMGMPLALARVTQAQVPATVLRETARHARTFPWREEVEGATLLRRGAGVVGAVTPWNMPVHQSVAKLAAALVAGCAVVHKPSEQTPYDAELLAALVAEAGAPDGLLNLVTGTGPVTGAALVAHPGLARVSFTGSVRAGRQVAALAAASLTRCSLELGGKSPAVLLPEVDLDVAVPAVVRSGLVNSGQACNATTRLLCPADLAEEVAERAVAAMRALRLGDPADAATDLGPLVTRQQREAVLAHVRRAVADGGTLRTGSTEVPDHPARGWFVEPVLVTGLPESAAAVREEIFGPVLVLQPYDDVDDACRLAGDSDYALSAEVWGSAQDPVDEVAARLHVGQVKVNGVKTRERLSVPFGGMRSSGYGRELGPLGIEELTDVSAVMR